jgi:Tol biopolymer transport system component
MTLDTRARRAAQGIHRAVEVMEMTTSTKEPRQVERFDHFRDRKQRNRRLGAILVAAALVITAVVLVSTNALDRGDGTTPAGPFEPRGRILYGIQIGGTEIDGIPIGGTEIDHLHSVDPDGGRDLDLGVVSDRGARWSPDGTRILVSSRAGPPSTRLPLRPATILPDGSGFTLLDGVSDPGLSLRCTAWSPDGSRLACEGLNGKDPAGLYTVRASDGGGLQQLSHKSTIPADYSPDGGQIVVFQGTPVVNGVDNLGRLSVMNTDGSGVRQITPPNSADGFADHTSWSPDGRWIAFTNSGNRAAIYLVHPDGTGLHQLRIDPSAGLVNVFGPAWSPDGEYLAFQGWDGEPDLNIDLYVARADGSHVVQITDAIGYDAGIDWTSAQT